MDVNAYVNSIFAPLVAKPEEESDPHEEKERLFQTVFQTEQGRKVLEILRNQTIEQPIFSFGFNAADSSLYAAMREGQNSIIRAIEAFAGLSPFRPKEGDK